MKLALVVACLALSPAAHGDDLTLIPEIMRLAPGATVPQKVYKKYSAKQIALSIVHKKYVEDEVLAGDQITDSAYDYYRDSEIQLAFDDKDLASIAQKGFLNTYQIGKAIKIYQQDRAVAEDKFLGYHLDKKFPPSASAEVRPKYAYFSLQSGDPKNNPLNSAPDGMQLGYGNVFAIFNDDVKNRATFTMGDSIGYQNKNEVRTLRYKSKSPLKLDIQSGMSYMEAQIWGPITIHDVNHFIVNCDEGVNPDTHENNGAISPAHLQELEKLHVPIFECAEDKVDGKLIRIREGKQIYPATTDGSVIGPEPSGETLPAQ